MKVFVTGVGGQLGYDVMKELAKRNISCVGSDLAEKPAEFDLPYVSLDITDFDAVNGVLTNEKPDAVIHCAAWTAVDAAEDEENREKVHLVNVTGTENIAKICADIHAKMLYISTDYVFDGQGEEPWKPDCKEYAPLNVYGESKLEGEKAVAKYLTDFFVVRIAWVFGIHGNNFVKTMLKAGKNHDRLTVVNDQVGTPTYTFDLAGLLADMIATDKYGYYHVTNSGEYISWYDFAVEIFRQAAALGEQEYDSAHLTVVPVTTEEYGLSKARRPVNSRLDRSKLEENGFQPLPTWQNALQRYLKQILNQ